MAAGSMLTWPDFVNEFGENFTHATIDQIKELGPKGWLHSLPMYEYAYTLVVDAIMRYGGELGPYINDLYITRMNPILKQHYDKLMTYRIRRAILLQNYDSMRGTITSSGELAELHAMKKYTQQTRKALIGVVKDFIDQKLGKRSGPRPVAETLQENYLADVDLDT